MQYSRFRFTDCRFVSQLCEAFFKGILHGDTLAEHKRKPYLNWHVEVARRTRLHALTPDGTGHQTSVQSTASMPLSIAPAHTVVPQSEWDLCPRALQSGGAVWLRGFAPLALLNSSEAQSLSGGGPRAPRRF